MLFTYYVSCLSAIICICLNPLPFFKTFSYPFLSVTDVPYFRKVQPHFHFPQTFLLLAHWSTLFLISGWLAELTKQIRMDKTRTQPIGQSAPVLSQAKFSVKLVVTRFHAKRFIGRALPFSPLYICRNHLNLDICWKSFSLLLRCNSPWFVEQEEQLMVWLLCVQN